MPGDDVSRSRSLHGLLLLGRVDFGHLPTLKGQAELVSYGMLGGIRYYADSLRIEGLT